MTGIAKALVQAQKEFGPALKSSTNPHFRTKYANLAICVDAVIDALNNNSIMLTQKTSMCEDGVIVETIFLHESGEQISSGPLHVPAPKHDPQGYGSALTYARRYSLMTACGLAPEDDDGNHASRPSKPKSTRTKAEIEALITAATSTDQLTATWKTLAADEREMVRDFAAKHHTKLKGDQNA
jgi:hypothetical protein